MYALIVAKNTIEKTKIYSTQYKFLHAHEMNDFLSITPVKTYALALSR